MKRTEHKTQQLQIRVSEAQKSAIRASAARAGMSISDWVLTKLVPPARDKFQALTAAIASSDEAGYEFAELLEYLGSLGAHEFEEAVSEPPHCALDSYWSNYIAGAVEHTAAIKHVSVPLWTRDVKPLEDPAFGSDLQSVRLYLLTHSPPAFSHRNIFIDATVGSQV